MPSARGRELLERARHEVILGDGPMGTMLYQKGMPLGTAFELLNVKDPDLVKGVHRQFVVAGAEMIETNTFGANAARLKPHGLEHRVRELCEAGAKIARAVAGSRVHVVGSVGPLGLRSGEDLPPDAEAIFREAIEGLAEGGVDLLFLETFIDLDELEIALRAARAACDLPVVAEVAITDNHRTPRGTSILDACERMVAAGADAFGVNCGKGPRAVVDAIEHLVASDTVPDDLVLTAFPNAGFPEFTGGRYLYLTSPGYSADAARQLAAAGVSIIGGCCGMTPDDIAAMRVALRGKKRAPIAEASARLQRAAAERRRERAAAEPRSASGKPLPQWPGEPTAPPPGRLERLRTARPGSPSPVVIVEIDPPKDLDPSKGIRAAQELAEAGVYAVTVGDNPLAVTRMGNLAFSHLVQREAGIPVVMHVSCRDRNLIGTQSELMGAHALGVRAVLAVTGDPASVGGQPGASSVYDMNSFGLVELIGRLNRGEDGGGDGAPQRTSFLAGVAFNPNGRRIDDQLRRLKKKAERGAHFAQTQPCYTTARVKEMYERAAPCGLPIFLGLLPLYSERAAQFISNEVPGIDIPDFVFQRLRGLGKDAARAEGVKICVEQIEETLEIAHGYYIVPPFNSAKAALELFHAIKDAAARRFGPPLRGRSGAMAPVAGPQAAAAAAAAAGAAAVGAGFVPATGRATSGGPSA